jgi:hypothetical protein
MSRPIFPGRERRRRTRITLQCVRAYPRGAPVHGSLLNDYESATRVIGLVWCRQSDGEGVRACLRRPPPRQRPCPARPLALQQSLHVARVTPALIRLSTGGAGIEHPHSGRQGAETCSNNARNSSTSGLMPSRSKPYRARIAWAPTVEKSAALCRRARCASDF